MKRHNRQSEQLLFNAEKMSELAVFFNYRDYYPVRDISEAWKLALLNQAHDLAAGSGIGPIYADAAKQYEEIFERGYRALNFLAAKSGAPAWIPAARVCRWWFTIRNRSIAPTW